MRQTQQEVDEVLGIMKDNVGKVLERDQKIENLENSSGTQASRSIRQRPYRCCRPWVVSLQSRCLSPPCACLTISYHQHYCDTLVT